MVHHTVALGDRAVIRQKQNALDRRGHRVPSPLQQRQNGLGVLLIGGRPLVIAGEKRDEPAVRGQHLHQHLDVIQLFVDVLHDDAKHIPAALGEPLFVLRRKREEIEGQQERKRQGDQPQKAQYDLMRDFQPVPPALHTRPPFRQCRRERQRSAGSEISAGLFPDFGLSLNGSKRPFSRVIPDI